MKRLTPLVVMGLVTHGCGSASELDVVGARHVMGADDAGGRAASWSLITAGGPDPGKSAEAHALAVLPSGELYLGGWFWGTLDLGAEKITSVGPTHDIFVAKLDAEGKAIWNERFGDEIDQDLMGLAPDANGGVVFTGTLNGTADFGGGPMTSAGVDDAYIAHLDAAGRYLDSQRLGDDYNQRGRAVAVTAANEIVAVGEFAGDLDPRVKIPSHGTWDAYLLRFTSTGGRSWTKTFGSGGEVAAVAVAASPDGSVAVTGQFRGTIDFGLGALVSAGEEDIYVVYFDAAGRPVFSRRFGGAEVDEAWAIAIDAATGNLALTGFVTGDVDFGCGVQHRSFVDAFVAVLTPDGRCSLGVAFGDESAQIGRAIAFDAHHDVVVAGTFIGSLGLGDPPPMSREREDAFVVKLRPGGEPDSIRVLGGSGMQMATAVAADASGNIFVAGFFADELALDARRVPSRGERDAFLARFGP